MDLFENPINRNGPYVRPPPNASQEIIIPELEEQPMVVAEDTEEVDISILPTNAVEVSIALV